MVLQEDLIPLVLNKLSTSTQSADIGEVTSVTTSTGSLDVVHETKTPTATVVNNILKLQTQLEEADAIGDDINAILFKIDAEPIDLDKHTTISKTNTTLIDYSGEIVYFIE